MDKKLLNPFVIATLLMLPMVGLALNFPDFNPGIQNPNLFNPGGIVDKIFNFIWMAFAAFAVIMFIWAGILFLNARGDPTKFAEVRTAVIYGSIGVVVALLSISIPIIINSVLFS